jgi:hypothetical protein
VRFGTDYIQCRDVGKGWNDQLGKSANRHRVVRLGVQWKNIIVPTAKDDGTTFAARRNASGTSTNGSDSPKLFKNATLRFVVHIFLQRIVTLRYSFVAFRKMSPKKRNFERNRASWRRFVWISEGIRLFDQRIIGMTRCLICASCPSDRLCKVADSRTCVQDQDHELER